MLCPACCHPSCRWAWKAAACWVSVQRLLAGAQLVSSWGLLSCAAAPLLPGNAYCTLGWARKAAACWQLLQRLHDSCPRVTSPLLVLCCGAALLPGPAHCTAALAWMAVACSQPVQHVLAVAWLPSLLLLLSCGAWLHLRESARQWRAAIRAAGQLGQCGVQHWQPVQCLLAVALLLSPLRLLCCGAWRHLGECSQQWRGAIRAAGQLGQCGAQRCPQRALCAVESRASKGKPV